MKKFYFAFFIFMISFSFLLGACTQKDNRTVVFETDFTSLQSSTFFGTYGNVKELDSGIELIKSKTSNVGPLTYFGTKTRNVNWVDRGLSVEATIDIDLEKFKTGDAFNLTVTLNNKDNQILTGVSACFRKFDNGLRIGYSQESYEEDNFKATEPVNESSQLINKNGVYVLEISFYTNKDNIILYNISLKNEDDKKIFNIKAQPLKIDSENVYVESVGGIRSFWLSYMTAESVTLKKLRITEN